MIQCESCGFSHLLEGGKSPLDYHDHFDSKDYSKDFDEHHRHWWDSAYEAQLRLLSPFYSLIDVGSGPGWFLKYTKARHQCPKSHMPGSFLRLFGVDLETHAIEYGSKLVGTYDDERARQRYDVVRMSLFLEHIKEPLTYLQQWLPLWQPKKVLIIVPNEFNPLQRCIGGDWFVSPWHWNYFTPMGLESLMHRVGYKVAHRGATFPIELFVLMGLDYRGNPHLGKFLHQCRLRMEHFIGPSIFKLYSLLHYHYGWGRELLYVFEKDTE